MKSFALLTFCLTLFGLVYSQSKAVWLYQFDSATPTKITNVLDGSKLYLSSSDGALKLSKITVTSNGQSKTLNQLLNDFDANSFLNGFPVGSDLTISTTNSQQTTEDLTGLLFISSPDMAKDPNFLVYSVINEEMTIDRSKNNETTMVFLNVRVPKADVDPDTKPFYYSRLSAINQSKDSTFYMYQGIPGDGYTDPSYKETNWKLLFRNPIRLLPTGETVDQVFFDNIEPIQYTLQTWHIRVVGGGITFKISRDWVDQTAYQTTKETTTGFTMSQRNTYQSFVNFKNTPYRAAGLSGYMINTADLFANMTVTTCNQIDCLSEPFTMKVYADFFQNPRNDTLLSMEIEKGVEYGTFYLQYFRTEDNVYLNVNVSSTSPSSQATTSAKMPETTTKSASVSSFVLSVIVLIASQL